MGIIRKPKAKGSAFADTFVIGSAASADQLVGLMDVLPDGIVIVSPAGKITLANAHAHDLLRVDIPNLVGNEWWDAIPDEVEERRHEDAEKALSSAGKYSFVEHEPFADEWLQYSMTRYAQGFVVTIRSVTERYRHMSALRDHEKRVEHLFKSNPNVMWVLDKNTLRILDANEAATRFYGYQGDDLSTLAASALFAEESDEEVRRVLPMIDGPVNDPRKICRQKKANGEIILVELSGKQIDWYGTAAILVSLVDTTERHLADNNLRNEANSLAAKLEVRDEELEIAQQELNSLHYAMSHDLQAPLHVVDGFAKTLLDRFGDALGERGTHFLNRIQASARQMNVLIDDLRMLSRVARVEPAAVNVNLSAICETLLESHKQRDPKRGVAIDVSPDIFAMGDTGLLTTVMSRLLDNAWKFTSNTEEAWIRVTATLTKPPIAENEFEDDERGGGLGAASREVIVCVSDNGAGFDANYVHKLFTPFQRLHSSIEFPGAGLGLAIVQKAADRLGARVWAEPVAPNGARFYIALAA